MNRFARRAWHGLLVLVLSLAVAAPASAASAPYSQEQLDRMLAPIALYPDPLLSQILMASTYPTEVVQAARWSRANRGLRGDAAVRAVADFDWDPSVKSLVAFPQILDLMDERLEWTEDLGEAFVEQEPYVMDTVQALRQRAYAAGHLRSNEHVQVARQGPLIVVEPARPQVVYVPYYDPLVVYGPWWHAHPPMHWRRWAGYHPAPGLVVAFHWGPAVTVSAGFLFGRFDWPRRQVHVVHHHHDTRVIYRQQTVQVHSGPQRWVHDRSRHDHARRGDEPRRVHVAPQEVRREEPRRPEARRDENRRPELRRDEPRRQEQRREEPRRVEQRREEPRPVQAVAPPVRAVAAAPQVQDSRNRNERAERAEQRREPHPQRPQVAENRSRPEHAQGQQRVHRPPPADAKSDRSDNSRGNARGHGNGKGRGERGEGNRK